MKKEFKQTKTKQKIDNKFKQIKNLCYKHKAKIIGGVTIITLLGTSIYFAHSNSSNKEVINNLLDLLIDQDNRIMYLEKLIEIKDELYAEAISELLRKGSPLGGKQMAYKRWA